MDGWDEYGVIGYVEDLDDPDIDPDPAFRRVLQLLNSEDVRTVSSCQGHLPGEKYEDVDEAMEPYVTLYGPGAPRLADSLSGAPHYLKSGSQGGPKVFVKFANSVMGRWDEVEAWILARL